MNNKENFVFTLCTFLKRRRKRITGREELKRNIHPPRCLSGKVERLRSETIKMSKFSTHNEHERNGRRSDSDNGDDELELARLPRFYLTCYSVFRSSCFQRSFYIFIQELLSLYVTYILCNTMVWGEGERSSEIKCEQHFKWKVHKFELCSVIVKKLEVIGAKWGLRFERKSNIK